MKEIYLIRTAQPSHAGKGLRVEGVSFARDLGRYLASQGNFEGISVSPEKCAQETGDVLYHSLRFNGRLSVPPIEVLDDLRKVRYETSEQVGARVFACLEQTVNSKRPHSKSIAITHAPVIKEFLKFIGETGYDQHHFEQTSVVRLVYDPSNEYYFRLVQIARNPPVMSSPSLSVPVANF